MLRPIRTLLSIYVLATALLGPFAVARPMPSTPSSQLQSSPASHNQITRREDSPDYHRPHLQRRQQFSEPELLQIGHVGPDGHYLLRSEPHSTPGSAGLLVGTEFFDLPSLKFMTSSSPAPDPSQYSRYFLSLEAAVEFASDEVKNKAFASLRDLSYLKKKCKRPNGFVNDLEYIDCALVIMKPYVVGQDKHRILDENWGRYKDNAISSSQSASAAPPAPAPGSPAPATPPAQMVQPAPVPAAPVQIVQPACDSESHPSNSRTSQLRFGRIDPSTNRWKTEPSLHRHDDIYVFMIDDHCFDYPSIAKPAETAEKPPFQLRTQSQSGSSESSSFSPHYYPMLKARVRLDEHSRKEVFGTLGDLEQLRVACGRTRQIKGSFEYVDCAVNYVGGSKYVVNAWPEWKDVWDGIKAQRKKDIEAEEAKNADKRARVAKAALAHMDRVAASAARRANAQKDKSSKRRKTQGNQRTEPIDSSGPGPSTPTESQE
ncbi:hypothetical protein F5878DRAFT_727864 [Lentinula raphanica]|uniref:Uncharacterized protein n=1 Tax=Lentinula raphanica TaxID=153919 RepID=A0AA38U9K1_9AGAR|nr:hypothetical protein F5878DRAFT_727864 [Lentinula raphanica]